MSNRPVTITIKAEFKRLVAHALNKHADSFGRPEIENDGEASDDMKATWIKNRDELRRVANEIIRS